MLNQLNSVEAVFNNPFQFRDRFSGAEDFYKPKDDIEPDPVRGLAMRRTNLIPDAINCELPLDNRRSPGFRRVEPFMTGNQFYLWIGQHENGRYSKAHAHTSAAILICIKGKGYTISWPERLGPTPWKDGNGSEVRRLDYEPIGLVTAAPGGARWYHQHFSVSKEPFRLTAWFGPHNPGRDPGRRAAARRLHRHGPHRGRHVDPYWMEDPFVREEYERMLAKEGVQSRMDPSWYERPADFAGPEVHRGGRGRLILAKLVVPRLIKEASHVRRGRRGVFQQHRPKPGGGGRDPPRQVGIDIGSSTSHLVFSRLVLERLDDRYVVVAREILHESEVLLTPTRTTSRSTRTVWGPLSSVSTGLQGRIPTPSTPGRSSSPASRFGAGTPARSASSSRSRPASSWR